MTHEVHSRPLPPATGSSATGAPNGKAAAGAAARTQASPGLIDRIDGFLESLWHFLSSMRVALVLMLLLAVLGLLGAVIIQAPPGVVNDPKAKADWLNEIRPMGLPFIQFFRDLPVVGQFVPDLRYGNVIGFLDGVQAFQMFNSVIFRVIVAGLTISLIACSVHRTPGIWRMITKPRVDVGGPFFEHAPQHEAIVVRQSPAEARAIAEGVLKRRRFRTLSTDDGTVHIYADRNRWALFAGIVGHLSLVVILVGAIVGASLGYRDSGFTLAEGATLPVGAEQGLTIELVDFTDTYYTTTGAPSDYVSNVILYKDGEEVARHDIRVNEPLRYGETSIYQSFFGVAAVMTVKDAAGNTLVDAEGVPLAWRTTDEERPIGSFQVPGTGLVGWVLGTLGQGDTTIAPGQAEVRLYTPEGTTPVALEVIDQGKATQVGDLTVTFERESQFTGLSVARDPGVLIVWLGAFLLFFGFVVRFMLPHKRVWGRIIPRSNGGAVLAMASLGSRDAALGTDFEDLVTDMRAALQTPAAG